MINKKLLKKLGNRWMLRYDNDGVSYGGYRCAPVGEWNTCPKWSEATAANCQSGGFFGQGPQASGYLKQGTRVTLCETRGPMFAVEDRKVKWREFLVLYVGQDALGALGYLTDGNWKGSILVHTKLSIKFTTVNGDCWLHEGASAPKLTTVRGDCVLHSGASAPKLTTVNGDCMLHAGASAPLLKCHKQTTGV